MKAPSPFLPDVPTLASLFEGAGIAMTEPGFHVGPSTRDRMATMSRLAPSAAPPPFRFPISTITAGASAESIRAAMPLARMASAASTPLAAAGPDLQNDEAALRHMAGHGDQGAPVVQRRIEGFVDWLGPAVGARCVFVADTDGLVLANLNTPENYVIATASLSHAEQNVRNYLPRPLESSTTMELDETSFLQVIRVDTIMGRLMVGLVVAGPLSRTACAMVRRLLRRGVEVEPNR
jgi:hypothetical protein